MKITVPYGKGSVEVKVPDGSAVRYPRELQCVHDVGAEIRRALAAPIGSPPLREVAAGKRDAVVVINDITRPAPSRELLAAILDELQHAGIPETAVTVVIATGNHRPNSPDEVVRMIGEDFARRIRVVNHACEDAATLATIAATGVDVPVRINSHVARASLRILTGLIAPHQAAGYSGGRKRLTPGVAALELWPENWRAPTRRVWRSVSRVGSRPFPGSTMWSSSRREGSRATSISTRRKRPCRPRSSWQLTAG